MYKLFIVLINYNFGNIIVDAINSIRETKITYKILIFDNSSTDDSLDLINSIKNPLIEIITSDQNLGFSAGCNRAISYIKDKYSIPEYIYLMNPDTIIPENLLSYMASTLDEKNAHIISPKIVHTDGSIYFYNGYIDLKKLQVVNIQLDNTMPIIEFTNLFQGASVMFRGELFKKLGGFNEKLFMYFDEAFFCLNAIEKGYKIIFDSNFTVIHNTSYSLRNQKYLKAYYISRNYLFTFGKIKTRTWVGRIFRLAVFELNWAKNYVKTADIKSLFYIMLGWFHYIIKKDGRLG